jgi:hypothetical protein
MHPNWVLRSLVIYFGITSGGVVINRYEFAVLLIACLPVRATSVTAVVPGEANPLLAGMPAGSICCFDATSTPPAQVLGLGPLGGQTLTFSVAGSVSTFPEQPPTSPPDGNGQLINMRVVNHISGAMNVPFNALAGVFLDDVEPDLAPTPPPLDFSDVGLGMHFMTLSPGLRQVFFIGDGLTGNGTGDLQQFIAPAGATRLFLGVVDVQGWSDNTGGFGVNVNGPAPAAAPEPGSLMLVGVGATLILLSRAARRRCRTPT